MAIYSARSRSTIVTASANAPLFSFRQIDNAPAWIREIRLFSKTAPVTSGSIGLARSTALGTGTLTTALGVPRDPNGIATSSGIVTNWATAVPSIGTVFDDFTSSASLGNAMLWTFDPLKPLILVGNAAATSELVFVNLDGTAPGTYDIVVVWENS